MGFKPGVVRASSAPNDETSRGRQGSARSRAGGVLWASCGGREGRSLARAHEPVVFVRLNEVWRDGKGRACVSRSSFGAAPSIEGGVCVEEER